MADPATWILTSSDGFSKELPQRFKPESYTPSTGGQTTLYRAYGSDKVFQNSDVIGNPQPIRLKALLYEEDETKLMDLLKEYTQLVAGAISLTRTSASWPSWTLIKGANYVETEVMEKAKRVGITLVLIPDRVSNLMTIFKEG